jgi:phosphoenolpyruvate synthase/pyruvate phosphate dikinase
MNTHSLSLQELDQTSISIAGGKAANLGELSRIREIKVPEGFCVTTEAYKRITAGNAELNHLLDELTHLKPEQRKSISEISLKIRTIIEKTPIPEEIIKEVTDHLIRTGAKDAYAIRSSATAEDLPTASFAGQQDTYLNIIGKDAILSHIRKCWASLFTERAVTYRIHEGFAHRNVQLAVVIQKMIFPQAAGILFTADPISSNRKILSIDASFGLGEALVAGIVNADTYKVRKGQVIDKKVFAKKLAIYASKDGGTRQQAIDPGQQLTQTLTDPQILQLEQLGRTIEAHFGYPQDIEWCLADETFYIVQSRPITTLFPIPEAHDTENHVYVSVGHQQMMTDPIKPLGISVWNLTAARPMHTAGGRLFVDITRELATPAGRTMMINVLGKSDPLIRDALMTILQRGDFIKQLPDENGKNPKGSDAKSLPDFQALNEYDPSIVFDLIRRSQLSIEKLKQNLQTRSGPDLLEFILQDNLELRKSLHDPQSFGVIMTAMNAASWINEKMKEWLGETNPADKLSQSVPNNITSEMGLALLDVADVIRPHPQVVGYLQQTKDENFLDHLPTLDGGRQARDAIRGYLDKYGMRCAGEIDITRTRWSEKPTTLIPILLSNIKNFGYGAGKQKFEEGRQEALKKEQELLARLKQLPDGEEKARETKRMIDLVRNLSGYREYPKYAIVSCYFILKQALMKEAERLVQAGVLHEKEEIYYLSFEELQETICTKNLDRSIIAQRKNEYKGYEKLTPPRIITSDGEIVSGTYKREGLPSNAIIGLAVSSGIIEGRARVIINMEEADLDDGDILVTPFTDPSWTPLFLSIKGLVIEVGGLMTHGAVIAREYGLPAVVGVENACQLIKDGQRIRVNATDGYIEIL